jgi:predicted phage tail protein
VFGSTVVLSWNPPAAGGVPNGYVLEAGSIPGASDLLTLATGNTSTSFTASGVQAGRYYVRVRAANAAGGGGPSNEVPVIVGPGAPSPGGSPPLAPTGLVATAVGSSVVLTWNAPAVGDRPTFYVIEAGSAPGLNDLAIVSTASGATSFSASGVGPGTYYVRVRSGNAVGVGTPSSIAMLVVGGGGPGPCGGAPAAPTGLLSQVSGSTVTLSWTAAVGSPTSYVLEAGSRPGGADITQTDTGSPSTSLRAAGVSPGTYFVRVRARNACGTSGPSNEVTAIVR